MSQYAAAIFDVDGVLVDSPHEQAWRESLQRLMETTWAAIVEDTNWSPEAFTSDVYQSVMSGKPRTSGALDALRHFDVPNADERVEEHADLKQEIVVSLIEAGQFKAYPDALRFAIKVRSLGVAVASASSSKNAGLFLRRIRLDKFAASDGLVFDFVHEGMNLLDFFDVDISGRDFAQPRSTAECRVLIVS